MGSDSKFSAEGVSQLQGEIAADPSSVPLWVHGAVRDAEIDAHTKEVQAGYNALLNDIQRKDVQAEYNALAEKLSHTDGPADAAALQNEIQARYNELAGRN
eukprot:EC119161.1.p2 GENE.EC119161.1~~EC119161.1.p2  ORF type:complete len:101 (+),score=14.20 EC119161.1:36-338(+)